MSSEAITSAPPAERSRFEAMMAQLSWGKVAAHVALLALVLLWTFPTAGLLISSLRDKDQLTTSGWWTALVSTETNQLARIGTAADQVEEDGTWHIRGNLFDAESGRTIVTFGSSFDTIADFVPGDAMEMRQGGELTLTSDGAYDWSSPTEFDVDRGPRVFYVVSIPPEFTLGNYAEVLAAEGIGRSFINSFTVTVPATVIPILIAAFAAYALAWMAFPFRTVLVAAVVGLIVVPLQMSLIPLLRLYNDIASLTGGSAKTYLGIWLAHTGFGLPLAIYLLRNYMAGLPRELMESARIDGASHFKIFTTMVLPLSFPALASFAIFQFLWVWNDLLVATVFLGNTDSTLVLTGRLRELLGSRGDNWEILTSGAFISIIVPLIVFFSLQRYFVRGLLAGSVKGG